ncbi:hypothetical protein FIBSPDRAFT_972744 [Athelia psychrophila]|uniref:C2H2-type domain-containing protein n=1 Tax=Athelia psychrophila TaxID=1759441 RepID=A0A166GBK0_9AGAM|nr:hypothetical protein FIBSPDRAFT_894070 [Fibularhizoctonia sp. CBS 109695]KZP17668.1 hypothetical protein FIBSPDRAFT_972744 [Fibularhizoctonia sp. CBS 109695]
MYSSLQIAPDVPVDDMFLQQIENWMQEISRYDSSPEARTDTTSYETETFAAIAGSIYEDSKRPNLHNKEEQPFDQAAGIAPQATLISSPQYWTVDAAASGQEIQQPQAIEQQHVLDGQHNADGQQNAHLETHNTHAPVPHMHNQLPVAYYSPPYYQSTTQAQNMAGMAHFDGYPGYQFSTTVDLTQSVGYGYAQNGAVAGPSSAPMHNSQWAATHPSYLLTNSSLYTLRSGSSASPTTSNFNSVSSGSTAPSSLHEITGSPDLRPRFPCLIPGCTFDMLEAEIAGHVGWHYRTADSTKSTLVRCEVPGCPKPGPYRLACMSRHIKGHYPEGPLGVVCGVCGKGLSRGDALRRHYLSAHKIKLPKKFRAGKTPTGPRKVASGRASNVAVAEVLHQTWDRMYSSPTFSN